MSAARDKRATEFFSKQEEAEMSKTDDPHPRCELCLHSALFEGVLYCRNSRFDGVQSYRPANRPCEEERQTSTEVIYFRPDNCGPKGKHWEQKGMSIRKALLLTLVVGAFFYLMW